MSEEQRRFPRMPSQHALLVKKLAGDGSEALAKTQVVGQGGCMFLHDVALGENSTVEILISVKGRVVRAVSRVVYELARKDGKFEIGVEFLEVSGPDRKIIRDLLVATS